MRFESHDFIFKSKKNFKDRIYYWNNYSEQWKQHKKLTGLSATKKKDHVMESSVKHGFNGLKASYAPATKLINHTRYRANGQKSTKCGA